MKQPLCIAVLALSWACIGQSQAVSQTSFWANSSVPGTIEETDTSSVTLGLQFYSGVPGSVTGVRFYKGPNNTGTHIGNLWSNTGTKLAQVVFSLETASGWQQANFSSPVNIAANTQYVISYLAPKGHYAIDQYYSWPTVSAVPLHVSNLTPGVYAYASKTSFPRSVWNASNYGVDLVFVPTVSNQAITYGISGTVTGSAAKVTLSGVASASANTDASGNYSFSGLPNGSYAVTATQSGFIFTPPTTSVAIAGASKTAVNFTATAVPALHSITVTWTSSTSPSISGYKLYRATVSGGPYTVLNTLPIATTSYLDSGVVSGQTYFYVATTIASTSESGYSTEATGVVPTP